jgi:hypothetical protein
MGKIFSNYDGTELEINSKKKCEKMTDTGNNTFLSKPMIQKLTKLTQKEIENQGIPITMEEIESIIKNFLSKKSPRLYGFTGEFFFFFLSYFFFYCTEWGTLWHLQSSYNVSNISYLNSPPSPLFTGEFYQLYFQNL